MLEGRLERLLRIEHDHPRLAFPVVATLRGVSERWQLAGDDTLRREWPREVRSHPDGQLQRHRPPMARRELSGGPQQTGLVGPCRQAAEWLPEPRQRRADARQSALYRRR